ncbi:LysE family translocator [Pragia fontium]|uniref:Threonine/homoserine/homoserine lactone efflux protein n=1 Tax=Pragia fontium DSM 5563 = ATCC 49100 TaxID=1122977 RepID=A0AAJ4WCX3_9GAMM|nr:LysE family translocator [Pragia fontium]SFD28360.1 Threonine/homoserine/homoserine lactone efflux protein [Pragia fontium DSM 5563 = ATCC 49100]SUB83894.1 Cysteine/O-acetylserine efflux protein [Pragia fontium]VEJ56800.1 Cysteine/O-acetylserine efflux protein [Pragia fontium]
MEFGLIFAMSMFSLSMSISPGPVNMVTIASSANHGFWRTFPFVSGATIGFTLLLVFVGFWFLGVIENYPIFFEYLSLGGSAFIIYVGYKIASSPPELVVEKSDTPSFMQGFLLQWLNPKAWIACASGSALFSTPQTHTTLFTFIVIYFVICYLSLAAWAVLGDRVSMLLNSVLRIRIFNLIMGGMLILTACYMLYLQFFTAS